MAKLPNMRGFVFVDGAPPLDRAARRWLKLPYAEVKNPDPALHISARKHSGLRHTGKLTYSVKPLNVESLDRSIRAHKKYGNHPAGVIVDVQFPCRWPPSPGAGSNARNPFTVRQPTWQVNVGRGTLSYAGKRGQSKLLP